jgi:hypothetical protein
MKSNKITHWINILTISLVILGQFASGLGGSSPVSAKGPKVTPTPVVIDPVATNPVATDLPLLETATPVAPDFIPTNTLEPTLAETSTTMPFNTPVPTLLATNTATLAPTLAPSQAATLVSASPTAALKAAALDAGPAITTVFSPSADAYVSASASGTNYGSSKQFFVDNAPSMQSYLRFGIQGLSGPVTKATLFIYAHGASSTGYKVHLVQDTIWNETQITYANAPVLGNQIGVVGPFGTGAWTGVWTSLDITPYILGNGTLNLALSGLSENSISFCSREGGFNGPRLEIVTGSGTVATSLPTQTSLPPTATLLPIKTATPLMPTMTKTSLPLTATSTLVKTATPVLPTATKTSLPSTATPSSTAVPTQVPAGNTRYVSLSGNDANPGTQALPLRTIQQAANLVNPGETILIRSGTYTENVVIKKSGSASAWITLAAFPGETVTIDGGNGNAIIDSGGQKYVIIAGLTLKTSGASANAIMASSANWGGSATEHWIIRNNKLLGGGIFIRGSYTLVENNSIDGQHLAKSSTEYQNGIRDSWAGGGQGNLSVTHHNTYRNNTIFGFYRSGIWSMGYTHDHLIEGNTIYDIYGTGTGPGQCIDLDGASTVEWRHIVRGNQIYGCGAEGIQLENVFDSLVENNYIHDTPARGITLINYGSSVGCAVGGENNQYGDTNGDNACSDGNTNNIIRQNVVVNAAGGAFVNYVMDGVHLVNNSAYGSGASMKFYQTQYLKYSDAINNIVSAALPTQLRTNSNNLISTTNVYLNPPADLSLALGSVAIDKGTNPNVYTNSVTGPLSIDFVGKPRLQGAGYDIGAYER